MLRSILIKPFTKPLTQIAGFTGRASAALWTFPAVLAAAIVIAWAAEAAQFFVSQGLALAVLAWLQTLPEFAVEAVISWDAGQTVRHSTDAWSLAHATALVTANFTGSLRLLVGLGWPMVYVTAAFFYNKSNKTRLKEVRLEKEHAVEVIFLLLSILYFFVVWAKGSLGPVDTILLTLIYLTYLFFLNKIPPQEEEKLEDAGTVPRFIVGLRPALRNCTIAGLFMIGGGLLYIAAPPFLESLKALAVGLGISSFVFVQWVAPFLSEFPEKVSAFNWARRVSTAPMALMNLVSSNINQWTMLAAMLPIAYALSLGHVATIYFDGHQKGEILLTLGQSLLGAILLANMRFSWWEALLLFGLWGVQFVMSGFEQSVDPAMAHNSLSLWAAGLLGVEAGRVESFAHLLKQAITAIYFTWTAIELAVCVIKRKGLEAVSIFPQLIREHW
jgi:cation:H+ antiporter